MYRRNSIVYFSISLILLIHLAGKEAAAAAKKKVDTRIVGGTTASISSIPYVVQIFVNNNFVCGGTLVSSRHVVSASHCFQGVTAGQVTVVGGATRLAAGGVRQKVQRIMKPNNFNARTMQNDVAVLKLAGPLTGPNIRPIALYAGKLKVGMNVKVSGWGKTSENAKAASQQLRTVNVPIIARAKCAAEYRRVGMRLTSSMFCASKAGRKDSCGGDSGGPVMCNGRLCGIVSFGVGCARRNYAGVYTNVNVVKSFILSSMKQ